VTETTLSPPWFHILLALASGPRHGYAIMQDVGEHYRLWPATLYTTIKRLLAEGLIEETAAPTDEAGADARRRFYRLTDAGRVRLASEASRLEAIVREARAKKVLPVKS